MLYVSHSGKSLEVSQMATSHLSRALAKLQSQKILWHRILQGDDPAGIRKELLKHPWIPAYTPEEMLARTEIWIGILSRELEKRKLEEKHNAR